ncbi:ABC transporter G family member 18-like [Condylostylus longicornis]|uniref:ABC transporter G family member 18-like n=1 Tax=Condylostylus longicornis TaxID=2530218 RepID=UPI00244DC7B3|nr:ABC transporter G family member 18-like [Condylostylus longicornis]
MKDFSVGAYIEEVAKTHTKPSSHNKNLNCDSNFNTGLEDFGDKFDEIDYDKIDSNEVGFPKREAVDIEFQNLKYRVRKFSFQEKKFVTKEILHGVNGVFRSGELTAIMGPSGAGKSTLLNAVSGFIATCVSGIIQVNGEPISTHSDSYRKLSAYIHQDDLLRPVLTTGETMMIAAHFKLGFKVSKEYKLTLVKKILILLGLEKRFNTFTVKLSGGQKKRLAIALELISNPSVLYLDEPTTGLDYSCCIQVVSLLKRLANEGRTIICTIHQPSALLFEMFDKLYTVVSGHCMYQGRVRELIPFLREMDLICPNYHNPADFLMEVAVGEHDTDLEKLIRAADKKYYEDSDLYELDKLNKLICNIKIKIENSQSYPENEKLNILNAKNSNHQNNIELSDKKNENEKTINSPANIFIQFLLLFQRQLLCYKRNYFSLFARIISHVVVGCVFGYLYSNVGPGATTVLGNYVYIYGSVLLLVYTGKMAVVLSLPLEMKMLSREHFNRWYKVGPYYLSLILFEIPFQAICTLCYVLITYYLTGNTETDAFRLYYFSILAILVSLSAQSWGFFVGATMPTKIAVFIGPILAVLFSVFGFCTRYIDITPMLRWMWHLSYFRFGFHGILNVVYGMNRGLLNCPKQEVYCHFKHPKIFLEYMMIQDVTMEYAMSMMAAVILVMHFLTIIVIWYKLTKKNMTDSIKYNCGTEMINQKMKKTKRPNNLQLKLSTNLNSTYDNTTATTTITTTTSSSSYNPSTSEINTKSNYTNALQNNIKGLDITFKNLCYTTKVEFWKKENKPILRDINGHFKSGELSAIMGPSGAGKSSLLNIISGFVVKNVTGEILVNDKERDLKFFQPQSAYITQDTNLHPCLSVAEAMNFSANLKIGKILSKSEKRDRVKNILEAIGMYEVRNVRTAKLSGGQRKRLSIALELVNDPLVLILDEPTSGLDSSTSTQCVSLLKKLALEGRTVICTIHQPSALVFGMFDHLYALAAGQCIYAGCIENLVPFLGDLNLKCPESYSPSDYLLEISTNDYGYQNERLVEKIQNGCSDAFRRRAQTKKQIEIMGKIDQMMQSGLMTPVTAPVLPFKTNKPSMPPIKEISTRWSGSNEENNSTKILSSFPKSSNSKKLKKPSIQIDPILLCQRQNRYAASFWSQLYTLLMRTFLILWRDKSLTAMRLLIHAAMGLFVGTLYYGIGNDAKNIFNNFRYIFFTIMFIMYTAFSSIIINFPLEFRIVAREHFNRWYSLRAYYVSLVLGDIPIQLLCTSIFVGISYTMTNQPMEFQRISLFFLMVVLSALVAQSVGLTIGAFLNVKHAVIFGPFVICPFLIFSGFFIQLKDCHEMMHWLFHISFLKYSLEGATLAIFGYSRPRMQCDEIFCMFVRPKRFLQEVGIEDGSYEISLIVLSFLFLSLRILAFYIMSFRLRLFR